MPSAWKIESWLSFQPWLASPEAVSRKVLHEAVAVAVAVAVAPRQGRLDLGPDRLDRREVAGALVISAGQHDEERRRVDRPVIFAERHLAEVGHLPMPRLVQDLARLRVGGGIDRLRLRRREIAQHAPCDRGIDPQHHHGRDDAVAPEHGREPWDAGVGVQPVLRAGRQHVDVRGRSAGDLVEQHVGALDRRDAARDRPQTAAVLSESEKKGLGPLRFAFRARDVGDDRRLAARRERDGEIGEAGLELPGCRKESECGETRPIVEPVISQLDRAGIDDPGADRAALLSLVAANLEQIAEVRREPDPHGKAVCD